MSLIRTVEKDVEGVWREWEGFRGSGVRVQLQIVVCVLKTRGGVLNP
jgi:hypothetical protein